MIFFNRILVNYILYKETTFVIKLNIDGRHLYSYSILQEGMSLL